MNRLPVDASMNGLPISTVPGDPAARAAHDAAIDDGPTTVNGPLASQPHTLADRQITADYASLGAAEAARQALLAAGIPAAAITLVDRTGTAAADHGRPPDDTLIGRVRDALIPDEVTVAASTPATVLTVHPERSQVETAIQAIAASAPTRFDPDLERWRNKG